MKKVFFKILTLLMMISASVYFSGCDKADEIANTELKNPDDETNLTCNLSSIEFKAEDEGGANLSYAFNEKEKISSITSNEGEVWQFIYDEFDMLKEITSTSDYIGFEVQDGKISKYLLFELGKGQDATVEKKFTYDEQGRLTKEIRTDFTQTPNSIRETTFLYPEAKKVEIQEDGYKVVVIYDDKDNLFDGPLAVFMHTIFDEAIGYTLPGVNGNQIKQTYYEDEVEIMTNTISNNYDEKGKIISTLGTTYLDLGYAYGCE